jgi:hypothetical protein
MALLIFRPKSLIPLAPGGIMINRNLCFIALISSLLTTHNFAFAYIPAQLNCRAAGGRVILAHVENGLSGVLLLEGTGARRKLYDLTVKFDGSGRDLKNITAFQYNIFLPGVDGPIRGEVKNAQSNCYFSPASASE